MSAYQSILNGIVSQHPPTAKYFKPLNLGRVFIDKSRKMYGVALETNIEKGVIAKLSEIADRAGATVRFIQVSMAETDAPFANAIVFLDFSNSNVTPEEALEVVKKQKFVRDAHIIYPSTNGTLTDEYFFPLTIGYQRAIILDKTVYESLFNGIREEFGSAGEAILYYQGFNVGYNAIAYLEKIALSKKLETLVELLKAYTRILGWGIIDDLKVDVKRGNAKVRLIHSFECELGKGFGKPYSQFLRGCIAGIFSKIFGKNASVHEAECVAKGDAYCVFLVNTSKRQIAIKFKK